MGCRISKPKGIGPRSVPFTSTAGVDGDSRYYDAEPIFEALAKEVGGYHPVRLVRMSWLLQQAGGRLRKRQECPEEAFLSAQELRTIWQAGGCGGRDRALPIITISFCWDTAADPDPNGIQLNQVCEALRSQQLVYRQPGRSFGGFEELGVFWDFPSLLQGDPDKKQAKKKELLAQGISEEEAEKESWKAFRTEDEQAAFVYALTQTMDLWYSHSATTVLLLTQHPRERGSTRPFGYDASGWPTFERCSSELIKKGRRWDVQWPAVTDLGQGSAVAAARRWPVGPDDFDKLVESKTFTNGSDFRVVKQVYRKQSEAMLGCTREMDFGNSGMSPMMALTRQDALYLGGCLQYCSKMVSLRLNRVGITGEAMQALCRNRDGQFLPSLIELVLHDNVLGDEGVEALADATLAGAFAAIAILDLRSTGVCDAGVTALAAAASHGALAELRELQLFDNLVGNVGAQALACASSEGFLGGVEKLVLTCNRVGDSGAEALAGAVRAGHLGRNGPFELNLCGNMIGESGMSALEDAGLSLDSRLGQRSPPTLAPPPAPALPQTNAPVVDMPILETLEDTACQGAEDRVLHLPGRSEVTLRVASGTTVSDAKQTALRYLEGANGHYPDVSPTALGQLLMSSGPTRLADSDLVVSVPHGSKLMMTNYSELTRDSGSMGPIAVERRGVTARQLRDLSDFLRAHLKEGQEAWFTDDGSPIAYGNMDFYQLLDWVVKPSTALRSCSFAEHTMRSADMQRPSWYVSHAFAQGVPAFVDCVCRHAEVRGSMDNCLFWVWIFAHNFHAPTIEATAESEHRVLQSAMSKSVGILLVLDEHSKPFQRTWCCWELWMATSMTWGMEERPPLLLDVAASDKAWVEVITDGLTDSEKLLFPTVAGWSKGRRERGFSIKLIMEQCLLQGSLDLASTRTSRPEDKVCILSAIAAMLPDPEATNDGAQVQFAAFNARVKAVFALACWRTVLEQNAWDHLMSDALHKDIGRRGVNVSFAGCYCLSDQSVHDFIYSLPAQLESLAVDASWTPLSTLEGFRFMVQVAPRLISVELSFAGCGSISDVEELCLGLAGLVDLRELVLSLAGCQGLQSVRGLGQTVAGLASLKSLTLNLASCAKLQDVDELATGLAESRSLRDTWIDLYNCTSLPYGLQRVFNTAPALLQASRNPVGVAGRIWGGSVPRARDAAMSAKCPAVSAQLFWSHGADEIELSVGGDSDAHTSPYPCGCTSCAVYHASESGYCWKHRWMSIFCPAWQRVQTGGSVMALLLLVGVTGALESERLTVGVVIGVAFAGCAAAHLVQSSQWAELGIVTFIMLLAAIAVIKTTLAMRRVQQLLYQHREQVANTINQAIHWSAAHANLDLEQLGPAPFEVDGAPMQQCSDLRTLYVQARQCIPELRRVATHVNSTVGGLHAAGGPGFSIRMLPLPEARGRIRAVRHRGVPDLIDLLSCTFDCRNMQEASACARALLACQQPMNVEVKRLDNGYRGAELSGGDRAILLTCSLGSGFLCMFTVRSADSALPEAVQAKVWTLARRAGLVGIAPLRLGSYQRISRKVRAGIGLLRTVSAAASLFLATFYFLEYFGDSVIKAVTLPLPHLSTACVVLLDVWNRSIFERSGRMRSRASHFYQRVLGVGGKLFFPRVVAVQTSGMLLQAVGKLSLLGAMVTTLRLQPPLNRPPRPSVDLSPGFWALVSTLVAHALFVGVYVGGLTRGASAAKQTIVGMLGPLLLQVSYILSYGACAFLVVQQGEILPASVTQDDKRAVDTDFFATDVVVGALSRPDKSFAFPDLTRPVAFFALALPAVGLMLTTRAVEERLAFLGHAARAAHSAQPPAGRTSRPRLSDHVPGPMLFGSPVGRAHATRPRHRCAAAAGALVSLVSLGLLFAILMVGNSDRFPLEPVPGCFPCWCPSEGELRSCGVAVDMRYKVLSLERAGITRIRPGAFSPSNFVSSPNLILEASFRGNALDELEEGTFQHMSYVTRLDLRDNSLRAIAPGAFEGLARAEDLLLDLSWVLTEEKSRCGGAGTCRLPALTVGSFLGLPRLRILGLGLSGAAGSGVPSVEPGAFSGLGSLEVLRLDSCACFDSLGRLPPGFFDGLGQLRVLVFSGTSLSRVSPGDFAGTPSLRVLDLHGTRLAEGGLEVQPGAFQELAQLRLLDLSDVQLEDLQPGALAGLVELRHLTLGNNALQRLRAGAMSGLGNLEELDLSGNPLTEVEPAALDDLSTPPLQSLSILRTPLQSQALACTADEDDCRDSFLAVWRLTRTFLSDVFVGGLGCSDARSLCGVDKGGTVIDPVCPVTCGTCGSLSDDGSAADCVDKDWAMTYTSTLASGVQLESGWPGADNTEWPLSRWTTCAHMVAAGACEHFYWNDVATLVCPVACGLCDALRARSCEDIDLFENSLLSCEVLVSTTSLCGDSGAFGDLIRLICPNSCGECSASAEGCAGGAASLTLGEVLELMNAGVDAPANTTPTPAPEPTIGN